MNSLKRAIKYSLMPHELGYCGPECNEESKDILRRYLLGEDCGQEKIRALLDEFVGAVAYYKLIAKKNNISDYFDEKVIEAYWLGNELLEKVLIEDLKEMILTDFTGPGLLSEARAQEIVGKLPAIAYAHHTFHVFFIGAVTDRVKLEGKNRDSCRPSWAKIVGESDETKKIKVEISKLFPNERIEEEELVWDKAFVSELKIGDWVACHWGRISEKINEEELKNLKKYTMLNYTSFKELYD